MARFQAAAALIDAPLLIVRRSNARIVFSNNAGVRALAALCGTRANGRCLRDALLPDPLSAQIFSVALKAGQGRVRDLLVPLPLVPGHQTWCRLSLESFTDDDDEPCEMITWQEVPPENEKHTVHGMLEASDYAKSEFMARLSHELRTPLNAIIGFAEMLCQEVFGVLGNEKYQEYARDIHESGRHVLRLINNLLDLARIEMGRYELNRRMIDAHAVIESARRHVRVLADDRAVIVALRLAEGMPHVYADE